MLNLERTKFIINKSSQIGAAYEMEIAISDRMWNLTWWKEDGQVEVAEAIKNLKKQQGTGTYLPV